MNKLNIMDRKCSMYIMSYCEHLIHIYIYICIHIYIYMVGAITTQEARMADNSLRNENQDSAK